MKTYYFENLLSNLNQENNLKTLQTDELLQDLFNTEDFGYPLTINHLQWAFYGDGRFDLLKETQVNNRQEIVINHGIKDSIGELEGILAMDDTEHMAWFESLGEFHDGGDDFDYGRTYLESLLWVLKCIKE